MHRAILTGAAVTAMTAALGTTGAQAAVTCEKSGATLLVVTTQSRDAIGMRIVAGQLVVTGNAVDLACAGGTPTTTTIDAVLVRDDSDNPVSPEPVDGSITIELSDPARFAPGLTGEANGAAEIEWVLVTNGGSDQLEVAGGPQADSYTFGAGGVNFNVAADGATPDNDVIATDFSGFRLNTGTGDDVVSLRGGDGTGGVLDWRALPVSDLGTGNDTYLGGDGADWVTDRAGSNVIRGFGGSDIFNTGQDDDVLDGGDGRDRIDYDTAPLAGVQVDLGKTGPQATGYGTDTLTSVEDVVGSNGPDLLTPIPQSRLVVGKDGVDRVSFARATSGYVIDLAGSGATDGDGNRMDVAEIEDVTASPFPDTIVGSAGPNAIDVRDGATDIVRCGDGADSVRADRRNVDAIDATCEAVDALPEPAAPPAGDAGAAGAGAAGGDAPAIEGAGGAGAGVLADRRVTLTLGGATRQRALRSRSVAVRVRCPGEPCLVSAAAKVGRVRGTTRTLRVDGRRATTMRIGLTARQLARLRTARRAGRRANVVVSVRAVDVAGNVATASRSVRVTG